MRHHPAQGAWALLPAAALALAGCGRGGDGTAPGAGPAAAAPAAGARISVRIDSPASGSLVAFPPGEVAVSGSAAVAGGAADVAVVYVVDVSESASDPLPRPCAAGLTTALACEIAAARALDVQGAQAGSVAEVGVVVMGGDGSAATFDAAAADMEAAPGDQPFTSSFAAAEEVLGSIAPGAVGSFTPRAVPSGATNFADALRAARALLGASARPRKTLVFLSDGANNAGDHVYSTGWLDGVVVRAFSVGHGRCDAPYGLGNLSAVAWLGESGSGCQTLESLAALPQVFPPGGGAAALERLELSVDGGPPLDLSAKTTPPLPLPGPAAASFAAAVALLPGAHALCATASGGGESSSACADVLVADVSLAPASAVRELGPGASHAVTAAVAAGAAGGVPGVAVAFSVLSGPNAGAGGGAVTDAGGRAAFSYAARQGLAGLGTDLVEGCFADSAARTACARAAVTWRDTTPPAAACLPGPNPSGRTDGEDRCDPEDRERGHGEGEPEDERGEPHEGGGHRDGEEERASGFFRLVAADAVDAAPRLFLLDSGSGTVFGPFPSGTAVKYTRAPGARPRARRIGGPAGAVLWHVTGTGEPRVYAVDAAGNRSPQVACPAVAPRGREAGRRADAL